MSEEAGGEVHAQLGDLESVVECPVCFCIPRELPIPSCPAGHILCRSCRGRVLHCPTCRRQLGDNTSSLAAALIERVAHRCSYWDQGCRERGLLPGLTRHEQRCPARTLTCPEPNGCGQQVKLADFHQHAVANSCSVEMRRRSKFNLSKGWLQWDGVSTQKGEEFNLREDLAWSFFHFNKFDRHFYFSAQYFAAERLFLFYLAVGAGQEVAEDFMASISLVSGDQSTSLSYRGPVQAVDTAPRTEAELLVSPACYCVHYHALSRVLATTDLGPPGNTVWSVDFTAVVDVENSMTFSG